METSNRNFRKINMDGKTVFKKDMRDGRGPNGFESGEVEDLPICVHGHLIHSPQELGGRCDMCGALLCIECAKKWRCEIEGNTLCGHHVFRDRGKVICKSHNLFRKLTFAMRPENGRRS